VFCFRTATRKADTGRSISPPVTQPNTPSCCGTRTLTRSSALCRRAMPFFLFFLSFFLVQLALTCLHHVLLDCAPIVAPFVAIYVHGYEEGNRNVTYTCLGDASPTSPSAARREANSNSLFSTRPSRQMNRSVEHRRRYWIHTSTHTYIDIYDVGTYVCTPSRSLAGKH